MSFVRKTEAECDYGGCTNEATFFHRVEIGATNPDIVYFKACWDHLQNFNTQLRNTASVAIWHNLTRDEYLVHSVMNT